MRLDLRSEIQVLVPGLRVGANTDPDMQKLAKAPCERFLELGMPKETGPAGYGARMPGHGRA